MEKKFDVASGRIYEEIDPIARWTSEPGFETLTVYLPGFRKEQLKVQATSTRKVRVMGERHVGGNKWIRFRKEFQVKPNVDMDTISAKFEGTNLIVKLPCPEGKDKQASPHQTDLKPSHEKIHQLPKPAVKAEASKGAEKVQESFKSPMEEQGEKEETSTRAEKIPPSKPMMEKQSEKQEVSGDSEKIKKKEKTHNEIQSICCKVEGYKHVLGGYLREMKNNKSAMSVGLVVIISMVVLSLGIYTGKRLRSSFEG